MIQEFMFEPIRVKTMSEKNNESAVSESIGVILAVALTVILAAIVAAYMFGMLNGVPLSRIIAVTAMQTDSTHIIVTYRGGPDAALLSNLSINWPDGTRQLVNFPKIGDVYTATNIGPVPNVTAGKDHVVVAALWQNNMSQVVLDTYV